MIKFFYVTANVSLLRKQRATGYPVLFLINMTGYQRATNASHGLPMIVACLYFFSKSRSIQYSKTEEILLKTSWNIKDFKKIYERATKDE